ncbi:MAG: hypothetical protein QXZ02_07785 [Candidatus Bathyarchaeia archaeon]
MNSEEIQELRHNEMMALVLACLGLVMMFVGIILMAVRASHLEWRGSTLWEIFDYPYRDVGLLLFVTGSILGIFSCAIGFNYRLKRNKLLGKAWWK